ncbi:MAG: response regulator [Phycisphaerales bacterium]|nr:response regulator [Phycisphaerales bacterium]MCB9862701.1 response regulator [Phycisphaerales bacterium]
MAERNCILIADASHTARRVLRAEIDPARFDVIETGTGAEAVELARKLQPVIVTVSFVLPDCDGIDVCKAVTHCDANVGTTVVMITSNDSDEDRHRAFEAGAVRFLPKGFQKGDLSAYVDAIVESKSRLIGARVLVADDNPFIRSAIAQLLQAEGAEVLQAADGVEGLKLLHANDIDVVLTDYHMPEMDGVNFVLAIRKVREFQTLPVLFLSGADDRQSRIRALDAGANDFIRKPFEGMELLARMRSFARLAELTKALKAEARTDELTGVLARREVLLRLDELCAESRRYGSQFSCVMLDIDHFKAFNDTHGHAAGDAVLKSVAHVIKGSLRQSDHFGRVGGEEFVILCPSTPLASAASCAEKVRLAVQESSVRFEGKLLQATISLGVAEFGDILSDADYVLNAADRALYDAKRLGRNRVCTFENGPTPETLPLQAALAH